MSDISVAAVGVVAALWLLAVSLAKPRLLTYAIFALAPTQFLFIPFANFFLSPADGLVLAAAGGFAVRVAARDPRAVTSLWTHRYVLLMIAAYLVGFLTLGEFSRTVMRIPMAVMPSILACELFRSNTYLKRAAAALILAAIVDGGYGVLMSLRGTPLHPTRFSGLSGVNFSAAVILTAAAIAFTHVARARSWWSLSRPGALVALGFATFSQAGALAFLTSWLVVLRRVVTRRNMVRLATLGVLAIALALTSATVRERLAERNRRQLEVDGVERNSADVRFMVMRVAWRGFQESPFVGVGYSLFPTYSAFDPEIKASTAGLGYGTHNTYLEILVEGGLLALISFALHFVQYLRGAGRILRDLKQRQDVTLAATLVGLPVVLVAALLANMLLHYHFWAVCGLALASLKVQGSEAARPDVAA
jgi:O-antigen ligase